MRSALGRAAVSVYAFLTAWILASYFFHYPIPEFTAKFLSLAAAAWLAYALHSIGALLVWFAGWLVPIGWVDELGPWNARLFRSMAGFAAVTFVAAAFGMAGPGPYLVQLRVLFGFVVVAALAGHVVGSKQKAPAPRVGSAVSLAFMALPAAGMAAAFLSSFGPITHYDSLVYHLALPALYLREGRIASIPFNLYSAFPGGCETLYAFIMASLPEPEYVINLLGWALALVLGGAAAEWSGELGGKRARSFSTALWWTTPAVLLLCQGGYVELPLAAATFLALRAFAAADGRAHAGAAMLFSGLFGGLALSIKYTGAITIVLLGAAAAVRLMRGPRAQRHALAFAGAAAVTPAPWLIKNAFSFGNPVFPFLYQWSGAAPGWAGETASRYFSMLTEYGARSNLLTDLLLLDPSSRGGFDVLGDFGWPLLLVGAVPALFL
ncbi:MAG: hypothetical protein JO102_00820, partial [Elusimicrobia bacterium]|nr:hypothetical protein [Elusimicrobiota bacterium]